MRNIMTEPETPLREAARDISPPRDPDAAQRALVRVQELLRRQRIV